MMNNLDPNIYEVHEQYRRDRMQEAEQQRLINIAKQGNQSTSMIRPILRLTPSPIAYSQALSLRLQSQQK